VLDASVVIAAVLSRNRASASCLLIEAAAAGVVRAIVSAPVVEEYRRKVQSVRARARIADPLGLVLDLVAVAESVEPTAVHAVAADPSDDVYLGTAMAGRADYLATFDRRHLLPLDPFKGVRVLTPGDVLRALKGA
jgi:putative PIN family toxin of toxin-antitoxin system